MWLLQAQTVRQNRWRTFDRIFSDSSKQTRYIQEIVFGRRREVQYWLITTDPDKLPENSTWYVMTKISGVKFKEVGNIYGLRNWIEYGLKQSKNELAGLKQILSPNKAQTGFVSRKYVFVVVQPLKKTKRHRCAKRF